MDEKLKERALEYHRHPTPGVEGADELLRFLEGIVAAGQADLATTD